MKIKRKPLDKVLLLELSGQITGGPDHDKFHGEIKDLIKEGQIDILLDFSKVSWINSTGLGLLISAYHSLKREGGRMKICGLGDRVRSVMYVCQLDRVFSTHDTCEQALEAFARGED